MAASTFIAAVWQVCNLQVDLLRESRCISEASRSTLWALHPKKSISFLKYSLKLRSSLRIPWARLHMVSYEARLACPSLKAAYSLFRWNEDILQGLRLFPECNQCGQPDSEPVTHKPCCTRNRRPLCEICWRNLGGCKRCLSDA